VDGSLFQGTGFNDFNTLGPYGKKVTRVCKCGNAGEPGHTCCLGPRCAADYQARISGPLLDRIDLQLEISAVRASDLALPPPKEKSVDVARWVAAARALQAARFAALGMASLRTNAEADGETLERIAPLEAAAQSLLKDAADAMNLSARGYHRVIRVARTIADLAGSEEIRRLHLAEALSYRQRPASLRQAA
jgi:magnesium chelatase family protein